MKVKVSDDKCIGCGSCASLTNSEIFDFNDDGLVYVKKQPTTDEEIADSLTAIEYCPTEAIEEVK